MINNSRIRQNPPAKKAALAQQALTAQRMARSNWTTGQWVTVKLDLHKMKEQGGFNDNVKTIRVGDNYNRNIYFRNFTFIPKAVPT